MQTSRVIATRDRGNDSRPNPSVALINGAIISQMDRMNSWGTEVSNAKKKKKPYGEV